MRSTLRGSDEYVEFVPSDKKGCLSGTRRQRIVNGIRFVLSRMLARIYMMVHKDRFSYEVTGREWKRVVF